MNTKYDNLSFSLSNLINHVSIEIIPIKHVQIVLWQYLDFNKSARNEDNKQIC